jgi:hypothetical protein
MKKDGNIFSDTHTLFTRKVKKVKNQFFKWISMLPLFIIILFAAYLDHEDMQKANTVVLGDIDSTPVSGDGVDEKEMKDEAEGLSYTLEKRLEKREIINGYLVETYREYEIYKDESGNVIKSVPTSNLDFLRYYINE